jgi:putative endonuclease
MRGPDRFSSCAGLTRASIVSQERLACEDGWIAGHRRAEATPFFERLCPAMTKVMWVYILASRPGGTLYVGVTKNLIRRLFEHREGFVGGFTKRYGVKMLVYYEQHNTAVAAIQREKNIKHWPREWKIDLVVSINPEWRDLYDDIAR